MKTSRRSFMQGLSAVLGAFSLPWKIEPLKGPPLAPISPPRKRQLIRDTNRIVSIGKVNKCPNVSSDAASPYYMHTWNRFGMCEVCGIHDMDHQRTGAGPRPSCVSTNRAEG